MKRKLLISLQATCEAPVEAPVKNAARAENWRPRIGVGNRWR